MIVDWEALQRAEMEASPALDSRPFVAQWKSGHPIEMIHPKLQSSVHCSEAVSCCLDLFGEK